MIGLFRGTLGSQEFTVTGVGFGHGHGGAAEEGLRLTDEYSLRGGARVRVGTRTATDPVTQVVVRSTMGVWLGNRFSVHTWLTREDSPGAAETMTSDLLGIFGQFDFSETSTGVAMRSLDAKKLSLVREGTQAPSVVRYIDGLGLVEAFERTPEQAWRIPKLGGAPVAGGELWISARTPAVADRAMLAGRSDAAALLVFRLVSDTSVVEINTDVGAATEDELLQKCARMRVDWKARRVL